jgi:hypothetical protein
MHAKGGARSAMAAAAPFQLAEACLQSSFLGLRGTLFDVGESGPEHRRRRKLGRDGQGRISLSRGERARRVSGAPR